MPSRLCALLLPAIILLALIATVGGPVVAARSTVNSQVSDIEHQGHCHLVSDCDAAGIAGHAGLSMQDEFRIAQPGDVAERIPLETLHQRAHFPTFIFRPPIA